MNEMEICGNCKYFRRGETVANKGFTQGADLSRVASMTFGMSRCELTGRAVKRTDPACTSFRRG